MRLASWEWFWYVVIGFLLGSGLVYFVTELNAINIKLLWYEWILCTLFIFIFIFMGQTFIASFKEFAEYEIDFVEKIAESIASTVSSVKINAKTQSLLEESQEMTEQMRSQEEEMRQNMEELQATQEEMQRGQAESESTMEAINDAISVIEFDKEGIVVNANHNFLDMMGYSKDDVVGEHHRIFVSRDDRATEEYKQLWKDLAMGLSRKGEFKSITKSGEVKHLLSNFTVVRGRDGQVSKIMMFAFDITNFKTADKIS